MSNDQVRLEHILEAIEKIQRFIGNATFEQFTDDEMMISAVLREFTVIGEAARHISDDFRAAHPELPLFEARGMRNRMIHEYQDLDLDIVWKTYRDDLPPLKAAVAEAMKTGS